jgi:hypothetical protein
VNFSNNFGVYVSLSLSGKEKYMFNHCEIGVEIKESGQRVRPETEQLKPAAIAMYWNILHFKNIKTH